MITQEQKIKLEQCLIKLSLQSGFDSFNSFRINQEYRLIINTQKNKLVQCLTKLALSLGFNSFVEFKKYKENTQCFSGYKSVYPKVQDISIVEDKIYVKNLKVMTGQNLYEAKTGSIVKLSDKLSKELGINEPPLNWWASEKWDGIRALWDGEKIISRGSGLGNPKVYTYVPQWFYKILPPGIALDGEIWIGRGMFQSTGKLSNIKPGSTYSKNEIDDIWSGKNGYPVIFKVFDVPSLKVPFEQRMEFLQTVVLDRKKCWDKLEYPNKTIYPLQFTQQIKIQSMEQLVNLYTNLTSNGAEGIMLRAPGSPYEEKRSKYMLKYKIKEDAECIVRGYLPGEGRLQGMLGALRCEMLKDGKVTGVFSNIGTGFTDIQRKYYNSPASAEYIPIGAVVSFSYMEMTDDGVPRHPVYRGLRFDIKNPDKTEKRADVKKVDVKRVKKVLSQIINRIASSKEQNWTFKIKKYKEAISILSDNDNLNTTEDYIKFLRDGGMTLADEEKFKQKNGTWKSSIIQKIDTILKTGTADGIEIEEETEMDEESLAIENLSKIAGIGKATAIKLYKEFDITTVDELKELYSVNKEVINSKQAIGLKHYDDLQKRIPRSEMNNWKDILTAIFDETLDSLNLEGELILSGSYRREKEDSGDVDVLIISKTYNEFLMNRFYKNLIESGIFTIENVIASGETKIMAIAKILDTFRHVDIFYYSLEVFPFALLFTTGSKEFNLKMRSHALKKGFSLNERYLTNKNGTLVSEEAYLEKIQKPIPETEEDIFNFLDYKYVLPQFR
jgi:ATP-dependent DNA ligase/DNA polymerase/3'-5' exonuclease PolX